MGAAHIGEYSKFADTVIEDKLAGLEVAKLLSSSGRK